jgi:hypothetical protein
VVLPALFSTLGFGVLAVVLEQTGANSYPDRRTVRAWIWMVRSQSRRAGVRARSDGGAAVRSIPRIARLMALSIRFEGLVRRERENARQNISRIRGRLAPICKFRLFSITRR